MTGEVQALLIGSLPGTCAEQLESAFGLERVAGFAEAAGLAGTRKTEIRGLAVGVPGNGHAGLSVDAPFLAAFPKLEVVSSFGVGYDHIDARAAAARGVVVTHTPNVLNEEVADTAMGLLLSTVRQLPQADRHVRSGRWLEKSFPLTATLRGRRMGILGLGRIGLAIAKRAEAFGIEVVYHNRNRRADVPYRYFPSLVEMAKAVDILMLIAPGGAVTRNIVNAEVLQALGPDGILINAARGSLVDEGALIEALRSRAILTAGLDVFADEPKVPQALVDMDHVVLFPHVGSASVHTRNAMGQLVVDNLLNWFAGKGPLTPVPETPYPVKDTA